MPVTLVSLWLKSLLESVAVMVHGVECLLHVNVSSLLFLPPYHLHNYLRPNIITLVDFILPLEIYIYQNCRNNIGLLKLLLFLKYRVGIVK